MEEKIKSSEEDIPKICSDCGKSGTCDCIYSGLRRIGKTIEDPDDDTPEHECNFMEELVTRTFVSKTHNAVKLTENMAREMFNSDVRIIIRPSGYNKMGRGAIYKRGESLVWKSPTVADTFEQVLEDVRSLFGHPDGKDKFNIYLYMD